LGGQFGREGGDFSGVTGYVEVLRAHGGGIAEIFAKQSIREMTRTNRTATQLMSAAKASLAPEGFDKP
jgi:hypothetical protein